MPLPTTDQLHAHLEQATARLAGIRSDPLAILLEAIITDPSLNLTRPQQLRARRLLFAYERAATTPAGGPTVPDHPSP